MSRGCLRRRKIPRASLHTCLSLFLLFSPGIISQRPPRSRRKSWAADGSATQRTASRPAVLWLFLYRSHGLERSMFQAVEPRRRQCWCLYDNYGILSMISGQVRVILAPTGKPDYKEPSSASQASRPSLTRNQTIASEVTASIHQAPKASWASSPSTTTTDSQRHASDSAASARRARPPS